MDYFHLNTSCIVCALQHGGCRSTWSIFFSNFLFFCAICIWTMFVYRIRSHCVCAYACMWTTLDAKPHTRGLSWAEFERKKKHKPNKQMHPQLDSQHHRWAANQQQAPHRLAVSYPVHCCWLALPRALHWSF